MLPNDLEISTDPGRIDVDLVHRFLTTSYWAEGRTREVVERSIAHSICFGAFTGGRQVAFGRVITDRAVYGYLADIFVVPEFRGRGIDAILYHTVWQNSVKHGMPRGEAGWILEDNALMNKAALELGFHKTKTYRVYDKTL